MATALVEVQRVSGGYSKRLNPFEVVVDDEVVGRLSPGESKAVEVAPGPHEIFTKIYWCRSKKVNVVLMQGQKVIFRCETRASNSFTDGYWATLGRRRYLSLTEVASRACAELTLTERSQTDVISVATSTTRGRAVEGRAIRPAQLPVITNALRNRQPAVAAVLLLAVGIPLLAVTWGFEFISGISIIYLGVQAVRAINFHLLAPRATWGPGIKSHEPFRFRTVEEAITSAVFALVGIATLTGVLHAGNHAGWLAVGAAVAGAANIVATRRSTAARSE